MDMGLIEKARKKLEELKEKRAEDMTARQREERLAMLEGYSVANGCGYHPVLVSELPAYAAKVDDYILMKGREDLREPQFDKDTPVRDILDMMEIGGVLEWKEAENAINELSYNKPVCCDEQVYDNPVEMNLEYLLEAGKDVSTYENLIGWHSQTLGIGALTKGDFRNMIDIKERIGDKPYYHVIYSTTTNRFFWYALEKNPEVSIDNLGW
jgi:hypothetical protein